MSTPRRTRAVQSFDLVVDVDAEARWGPMLVELAHDCDDDVCRVSIMRSDGTVSLSPSEIIALAKLVEDERGRFTGKR